MLFYEKEKTMAQPFFPIVVAVLTVYSKCVETRQTVLELFDVVARGILLMKVGLKIVEEVFL